MHATPLVMSRPPLLRLQGCGKSHILFKDFIPLMTERFGAPPASQYCHIDPDLFITRLCANDNHYRGCGTNNSHGQRGCRVPCAMSGCEQRTLTTALTSAGLPTFAITSPF